MDPVEFTDAAERVGEAIQGVAGQAIDAANTDTFKARMLSATVAIVTPSFLVEISPGSSDQSALTGACASLKLKVKICVGSVVPTGVVGADGSSARFPVKDAGSSTESTPQRDATLT